MEITPLRYGENICNENEILSIHDHQFINK